MDLPYMMNGLPYRTVDHLVEDILPTNSDIFQHLS